MAMAAQSKETEIIDIDKLAKLIAANAGEFSYRIEKKEWDRALQIYESCDHQEKKDLLCMKITRSGGTALHKVLRMRLKDEEKGNVAATFLNIKDSPATFQSKKEKAASFEKKKEIVMKLVEGLKFVNLKDLTDDTENTPLHLAVAMEDDHLADEMEVRQQICMEMAINQPDGISLRNKDGETPLFLAALYGSKDSFINLCEICCNNVPDSGLTKIYEYGRRSKDGSTVLHCAINEEFFDLALEIVHRFPEFVHRVDQGGYSPLHLLATKTAAFKSSCPRTWLQDTIYGCLPEKIWKWTEDWVRDYKSKTTDPEGVWKTVKCFLEPIVVILDMKEKHRKSIEIMNMLLSELQSHNYMNTAANQENNDSQVSSESSQKNKTEKETPIRLAAKNGIRELVEKILHLFPEAMYDTNPEGKNVMHIALENRNIEVYKALTDWTLIKDLLHHNDENGNNALHHAATLGKYPPWRAPKAVLKMQHEIKWFESIKGPLPKNMLDHQNNEGKTPYQTFMETHEDLVKSDTDWLLKTTESCTLVAALIATVAFATSASLPGGINGYNGEPILQQERMFEVFAISSLVALCFSLTAVLMFLSILTSRHQAMDFHVYLPRKLLIGLTALFISIASMLVSFCGGHFFVLRKIVKQAQVVEYLVAFLPVMFFIIAQCPLYIKLFWATVIKKEP
ncbi:Ankyrin repeat-containing protein NPR4 [Camellia lanceoleosa]|uniref:Ankyrin repeat-containing protein NPR4 n=1 Tax=Camellia lanceoleosa TaxID=1840588 RepID=A0ACC0F850_9ERIC|nr:Ankyrin repeat-containing protein NPR4 [Camellia lanceoleosa]